MLGAQLHMVLLRFSLIFDGDCEFFITKPLLLWKIMLFLVVLLISV